MAEKTHDSILGFFHSNEFYFFIYLSTLVVRCCSYEGDSFTISSFKYGKTSLKPYDWRYIRVDLPTSFSSLTIALESNVNIHNNSIGKATIYNLPMICIREGSPPLPDAYNTSLTGLVLEGICNESLGREDLQFANKCYPMQKNIYLRLTNEQISAGVWYFGLFNGIGSMRTQSLMTNRGLGFSFTANVSFAGCMSPSLMGPYCNQTIHQLSCVDYNSTQENIVSCGTNDKSSCSSLNQSRIYSLDLVVVSEEIIIFTSNVKFNETQTDNGTSNFKNVGLMYYARHGAMPSSSIHDYSGDIIDTPLAIRSPIVGRWYITILPVDHSNGTIGNKKVCYSLLWQIRQCPQSKAGLNCTWERYMLQTILKKNSLLPFESYYLPVNNKGSSSSAIFLLEPLLSNYTLSQSQSQDFAWTYFVVDIPSGGVGGSIHVRINSNKISNYEIYALYGGLPLQDKWDYFYVNLTSNSNGSMFFKLYDSDEKSISFYIIYARGGTWTFGIKHLTSSSQSQTTMAISVERCPRRCSSHGTCRNVVEMSGLSLYSYCSCDRNHGGFDCSVELVSPQGPIRRTEHHHSGGSEFGSLPYEHADSGNILQSVLLIASNVAFVFPAYGALRKKAYAEWVMYTSSGISSALYHACDVGIWCALSFHVLQFMDLWLSFMAVVSTFVYLAAIDEASKRTIHTIVAILTALMAENGATRFSNIVLVITIGSIGLLAGCLIEFISRYKHFSLSIYFFLNILHRWPMIKGWIPNLLKTLIKHFRWFFVVAGLVALAMAAISWSLESTESYWFWHSIRHVSMYTSSFFFLCSEVTVINNCENQESTDMDYRLTSQDSLSRGEDRLASG